MSSENKFIYVAKTPAGKEIGYRETGSNRFKEICFSSGGETPEELKGMWMDDMAIKKAINVYVAKKERTEKKKEEKHVDAKS